MLPGLITEGTALNGAIPFKPEVAKEWLKRLPDITEYRLADMDEHGVAMQVLSLTPPGVQMQPDAAIAVRDAQHANDAPAAVVAAHPTRFGGLAALPLQNPEGRRARSPAGHGRPRHGRVPGQRSHLRGVPALAAVPARVGGPGGTWRGPASAPHPRPGGRLGDHEKIAHRNAERLLRL